MLWDIFEMLLLVEIFSFFIFFDVNFLLLFEDVEEEVEVKNKLSFMDRGLGVNVVFFEGFYL